MPDNRDYSGPNERPLNDGFVYKPWDIINAHRPDGDVEGFRHCVKCGQAWPCDTYAPVHARNVAREAGDV